MPVAVSMLDIQSKRAELCTFSPGTPFLVGAPTLPKCSWAAAHQADQFPDKMERKDSSFARGAMLLLMKRLGPHHPGQ